eukprot:1888294-Ditylum_brightwellii.AAC.1
MAQPHNDNFIQQQIEEIYRQQHRLGKSHPEVAESLNVLALYFRHVARNYKEALKLHTEALDILKVQPAHTQNMELAVTIVDIGDIHRILGDYETAKSKYTEALRISMAINIPKSHPAVGGATRGLRILCR